MSKYIRDEKKGQIISVIVIILAVIIGLAWNYAESCAEEKTQPDAVYPMTNIHISWEQTFHPGGWNDAGT